MCERPHWIELLSGSDREEALNIITKISSGLLAFDPLWRWYTELEYPDSLGFGDAGLALCLSYIGRTLELPSTEAASVTFLNSALNGLNPGWMPYGFFRGGAGICWVASHITQRNPARATGIPFPLHLQSMMKRSRQHDAPLDFFEGVSGGLTYICATNTPPGCRETLDYLANRILTSAEATPAGITWAPSDQAAQSVFQRLGQNVSRGAKPYILGIHGVSGILGSLLVLKCIDSCAPRLDETISGAIEWLLNSRVMSDPCQGFPLIAGLDAPAPALESLKILPLLLNASSLYGRADWEFAAIEGASRLARNGRSDIPRTFGLHAGCSGLAHLFNRFFQATSDEFFADAARYWYRRVMASRVPAWENFW